MKEIITLCIEDPYVRKTLGECKRDRARLQDLMENGRLDPYVDKWAACALYAVESCSDVRELDPSIPRCAVQCRRFVRLWEFGTWPRHGAVRSNCRFAG